MRPIEARSRVEPATTHARFDNAGRPDAGNIVWPLFAPTR